MHTSFEMLQSFTLQVYAFRLLDLSVRVPLALPGARCEGPSSPSYLLAPLPSLRHPRPLEDRLDAYDTSGIEPQVPSNALRPIREAGD